MDKIIIFAIIYNMYKILIRPLRPRCKECFTHKQGIVLGYFIKDYRIKRERDFLKVEKWLLLKKGRIFLKSYFKKRFFFF